MWPAAKPEIITHQDQLASVSITPDQIDPNELTGYARRTLRIVNALQA
jgi:hypothetical protein